MKVSQTLADKRRIERNIRGRGLIFRRLFRQVVIAQESRVLQRIPSITKPTLSNVMDREYENKVIALAMRPFYITTITDSASEIFKEFPEPEFMKTIDPMDALDADIFKYANQYSIAMARYVNKTTARKIKRIVQEGLKGRLHYSEIVKRIKIDVFKDLKEGVRARRLAHTEAHGMVENGRQQGAKANKVVKTKTWSAAADARDTHGDANGQTVPKNEAYIVGGYQMMFPGDTSLGAGLEEIINCRCSSLFSSKSMPTKEQLRRSLETYQDGGFQSINGHLRGEKIDFKYMRKVRADIRNMDSLMKKATDDYYLYRGDGAGISANLFEKIPGLPTRVAAEEVLHGKIAGKTYAHFLNDKLKGVTFKDKAFVSTSKNMNLALENFVGGSTELTKHGATGFVEIATPRGTRLLDVEKTSLMRAGEGEMILSRGMTFKIEGVNIRPTGVGRDVRFYIKYILSIVSK